MSFKVENQENNTAKLTIEVEAETFEKAIEKVFKKNKNQFNIPGFRKGKVPYSIVEKMYGPQMFYEDAANDVIPGAYADALKESGLDVVAQPEIDVVEIEKGKPFVFTAEVVLKPEAELGKYKGIKTKKPDLTVSDDEIMAELLNVQKQNSRLIAADDRPVEDGDQTIIDFEGFIDGETFEGGKGEDYPLTIGSHSFIDTFEEQLIGKKVGEECEVNVTFPDDYQAKELCGKPALFKVTVKEIKYEELPELDDDFVQDVSEFDTLDEYKADIKKSLAEKKEQAAKTDKENEVIDKIIEDAKMEIHEKMIDAQARNMLDEYARSMQSQGLSLEQYMQLTGMTADSMIEQMKPQAEKRIKTRLVLEAVAKAEGIEATDEDVEEEIKRMAESYGIEADKFKGYLGDEEIEQMKADKAVEKALDFVVEAAK